MGIMPSLNYAVVRSFQLFLNMDAILMFKKNSLQGKGQWEHAAPIPKHATATIPSRAVSLLCVPVLIIVSSDAWRYCVRSDRCV